MVNIPPHIFKSYDIRGIYPQEINEENIDEITRAIFRFLKEGQSVSDSLSVVIGRDMRLSGPGLYRLLQKTLVDAGASVIDIGLASTPTVYFTVHHYGYDAGIQLSASHNPPQYNGLKIVKKTDTGLMKIGKSTGMDKIKQYALEGQKIETSSKGAIVHKESVLEDEIVNAQKIVGDYTIKPLKIVADAANAMGAVYLDALFKQLPCQLIRMNFNLDGSFPAHQPDPLVKKNLVDLQKRVIAEKADLGLAPDGDGDRLFFIDEKGEIAPASCITALVARELLKKYAGATILYDIRYTRTAQKIIEASGGKTGVTKVGHAFITEAMHKAEALFAGESSGHYYFKATGYAESQLPVILTVLSVLSSVGKPLSSVIQSIQASVESGEYNFKTDKAPEILAALKEKYADAKLITLDGVVVEYPSWRFGVRTSNTEPLMRLNLEADTKELMLEKREQLIKDINNLGAELLHD